MLTRLLLIASLVAACLQAGEDAWPCFHGARRDNRSDETGLLTSWPEGGPKLLWSTAGIGHGYSSVAVAGGRIFTAGTIERQTHVVALDLDGKILWKRVNGESWQAAPEQNWAVPYDGARGTPTVDGDTVYHLSELGRLAALDVATGEERWQVNVLKTFEGERPKYGLSDSVLIQGERVICSPGGDKGYIVALEKKTGRTLWANAEIKDPVGYCSPVPAQMEGVEQIILLSGVRVFAVNVADGKLLWEYPYANGRQNNATDVIVRDGLVFVSSGYGKGSALLKPGKQADGTFKVEVVWSTQLMDCQIGGVVLVGEHLYGAGHESRGWFCLEFKTGKQAWQEPGKGSLTYADERLYCLDEKGTMNLVVASPAKWESVGSFAVPKGGRGAFWAHPVVCGGRLYLRHSETLNTYQVK
jgi:outer membrane protein assembly factor BamB